LWEVGPEDIIITDLYCPAHDGETVVPTVECEQQLVNEVKVFFKEFSGVDEVSYGYINNFYECTVRPLFKFISAIKKVTCKYPDNLEFHLPAKIALNSATSTYYMAEHESFGTHLYDRHSSILPYLIEYLGDYRIEPVYKVLRFPKQRFLYNLPRVIIVSLGRFYKDLKGWVQAVPVRDIQPTAFKHIFIIRTLGQAHAIMPYLHSSMVKCLIINMPNGLETKDTILMSLVSRDNISIATPGKGSLKSVLFENLRSWLKILRVRATYFAFDGVRLNVTQALREITAMSATLNLYHNSLLDTFTGIRLEESALAFSLEQKSPHAHVDALVARRFGITAVQVKQCNQSALAIPEPVFSDFYLCDLPEVMTMFHTSWPDCVDKVRYIGTLSAISKRTSMTKVNPRKSKCLRLCFFSGTHSLVNLETLTSLHKLSETIDLDLVIKLHPRDNFSYESTFPNFTFIKDSPISFMGFTSQFDLALTYPSGIVTDLIYSGLPFVIFIPHHSDYQSAVIPNSMDKILQLRSSEQVIESLIKKNDIILQHTAALDHFYRRSNLITDLDEIERQLALLGETLLIE
jgi:hypothetical protein